MTDTRGCGNENPPDAISGRRFREIALRMLESQALERTRMSRFLHDEVAQFLSGAGLQLDILRMDLEERVPEIGSRTAEIQTILDEIVTRVRELSYDLNHEMVERTGLQPALDRLVGFSRRSFRGKIRLMYDSAVRVSGRAGAALFYIVEQALDNAVRHSGAERVEVIFKMTGRGPALEVRDDGCGFDPDAARRSPSGLGMIIMDHYSGKAGVILEIVSEANQGSIVRAIAAGDG